MSLANPSVGSRHPTPRSPHSRSRDLRERTPNLTGKSSLAYCPVPVSDVYKAIADPARRAILDELLERDRQTLFELCGRLATKHGLTSTRQAISQHLEVLQAAGLVIAVREGRYKYHSIDTRPLQTITDRWPQP